MPVWFDGCVFTWCRRWPDTFEFAQLCNRRLDVRQQTEGFAGRALNRLLTVRANQLLQTRPEFPFLGESIHHQSSKRETVVSVCTQLIWWHRSERHRTQPMSQTPISGITFLVNYVGCESISIVLTVSFHSMILTSSACVRERSDRAEIAAGSSSWNLTEERHSISMIYCVYNCILFSCKNNNEQKMCLLELYIFIYLLFII